MRSNKSKSTSFPDFTQHGPIRLAVHRKFAANDILPFLKPRKISQLWNLAFSALKIRPYV